MIIRMLALAGGLAGGAALSQYPEFTQQYVQRLGGQIDALTVVVEDFDATAERSGLTRDAALAQMTGTPFLDDRRADMTRTIRRYESLSEARVALDTATPMERLMLPHRMGDSETFRGTWEAFEPALPLTLPGAVAAGAGYLAGWLAVAGMLSLLALPFRGGARRRDPYDEYDDEPQQETAPPRSRQLRAERGLPQEPPLRRPGRSEPPLRRRLEPGE
ncbi:DUF2937 family protein [Histidinibacterium aquaticum]|uniref:DUF2937 family protein n=1 Tax=Histidinibacterium aquaticum TaxID=2613962 RepID=A0A5J5GPC2_9RHOB|nr:DUF2937 family protein [Histidinibacterium aquaticum]KAA9009905.1 DUF2937 family protein [Histidinibacterium aquaticum]